MATKKKKTGTGRKRPSRRAGERRARKAAGEPTIPPLLFAEASPRSLGGLSMFDAGAPVTPDIVAHFGSDESTIARALARLEDAGFQILQVSPYTINIAAPIEVMSELSRPASSPRSCRRSRAPASRIRRRSSRRPMRRVSG